MESIAVYWEPVVRVYGFDTRSDVSLIKVDYPIERAGFWAEQLQSLEDDTSRFLFSQVQLTSPGSATMSIAVDACSSADIQAQLSKTAEQESTPITLHQSVDLLFFHGPHFQDRYGIAETAFSALDLNRITVYAVGCTGTSIYIITAEGEGPLARKMLSDAFTVPKEHVKIKTD